METSTSARLGFCVVLTLVGCTSTSSGDDASGGVSGGAGSAARAAPQGGGSGEDAYVDAGDASRPVERDAAHQGMADAGADAGDAALPSDDCRFDGDPFDARSILERVSFLASDALEGRAPGTDGDVLARAHIEARFSCLGLLPGGDDGHFQMPFIDHQGNSTANVVGYVAGSDPSDTNDIIVVGAHHDHLGWQDGELHRGANDNASGIAGLLAIAQALQQRAPLRRTVAFVAFGSEEPPWDTQGSATFVAEPPQTLPIDRVVYMINLDMIGTYDIGELVYALGTFEGTPAREVIEALLEGTELNVDLGEPADDGSTDFDPFCEAGIPYVSFWTEDEACYHQACDTADRIDAANMAGIAALAAELSFELAATELDLLKARDEVGCEP